MLFLAVTLGFFVENQREHYIEHLREKQFIASMIKELQADTAQMSNVLQDTVRPKGIDSLLNIIYSGNLNSIDLRMVYYLRRKYTSNMSAMVFSRNTITQLKSSGNMRLIRNREVVDSLNQLDNLITLAEGQLQFVKDNYHPVVSFDAGIFNDGVYRENGQRMPVDFVLISKTDPQLLTNDYNGVIQYANMIGRHRGLMNNYLVMIKVINEYSATLIPYLKKEYHLE